MLILRKEYFGGIICSALTGEILQLNESAYKIVSRYCTLRDKREFSDAERKFIESESIFSEIGSSLIKSIVPAAPSRDSSILSAPESIILRLTTGCNKKCVGCYENRNELLEMDVNLAYKILEDASKAGVCRVQFGGGEAFEYRFIFDLIKYAHENNLYVSIGSNGTYIDENIAAKIKASGLSHIQLSLNNPDMHGRISTDIIRGAKILSNAGIDYGFNLLITAQNYKIIDEAVALSKECGAKKIKLIRAKPSVNNHNWYNKTTMSNDMITKIAEKIVAYNGYLESDCAFSQLRRDECNMGCIGAVRTMTISPNGRFAVCPFFIGDSTQTESILAYPSLNEAWMNSPLLKSFRDVLNQLEGYTEKHFLRKSNKGCRWIGYWNTHMLDGADNLLEDHDVFPSLCDRST